MFTVLKIIIFFLAKDHKENGVYHWNTPSFKTHENFSFTNKNHKSYLCSVLCSSLAIYFLPCFKIKSYPFHLISSHQIFHSLIPFLPRIYFLSCIFFRNLAQPSVLACHLLWPSWFIFSILICAILFYSPAYIHWCCSWNKLWNCLSLCCLGSDTIVNMSFLWASGCISCQR